MFRFWDIEKRRSCRKKKIAGTKRKRKPHVEQLEGRELLTVSMTGAEQLMLELVNRARMDPVAELAFHPGVSDLNQGSPSPAITPTPKQPLAPVQTLTNAAGLHSQDMITGNYFAHTNLSGLSAEDRAQAAGYPTYTTVAENLNFGSYADPLDIEAEVIRAHESLFGSPGHRTNMLKNHKNEVGMGVRSGLTTPTIPNPPFNGSATYDAVLVTQKFGERSASSRPYITGVLYDDSVQQNDFYNIGEGLGNASISMLNLGTGTTYYTTSGPSGGYELAVPAGYYTVVVQANGQEMLEGPVVVTTENIKVDFNTANVPQGNYFDDLIVTDNLSAYVAESNGVSMAQKTYSAWLPELANFGEGDLNGDGLGDIVGHTPSGQIYVGLSTGLSSFAVKQFGTLSSSITWTDFTVADFNADGKDDIMVRADSDGSWWALTSTGNEFTYSHIATYSPIYDWTFVVGDFNNDDRADVAGRAGTNGSWWVGLSDGTSASPSSWGSWNTGVEWTDFRVGDFNGDGRDDVAGRANGDAWWVAESDGSSFASSKWASWTGSVAWEHFTVGDFDGDGDDDIVGRASSTGDWWMAVSTGVGSSFTHALWGNWPTYTVWSDVHRGDFNGDERSDLIGRAANGEWWILESAGSSFNGRFGANFGSAVVASGVEDVD